jgi:diguanylate cyclase (GGDEF)-like protein
MRALLAPPLTEPRPHIFAAPAWFMKALARDLAGGEAHGKANGKSKGGAGGEAGSGEDSDASELGQPKAHRGKSSRSEAASASAVLVVALHNLHAINRLHGRAAANLILQEIENRLRLGLRESDYIARVQGPYFAIMLSRLRQADDAETVATRLMHGFTVPFTAPHHKVAIHATIGIALPGLDGSHADELLKSAFGAAARAQTIKPGMICYNAPAFDVKMRRRQSLQADLHNACTRKELEIYYQPVVALSTGKITGFEALLRWRHPAHGMVPPLDFIPWAEESGLISEIGAYVLYRATQDAKSWPDDLTLAVNVSPLQMEDFALLDHVEAALHVAGFPAGRLELEVTESAVLFNGDTTQGVLGALHDRGVRIAMDDFGTGYASLETLRRFPFDKLKIDRSFIADLGRLAGASAIVRGVIGLGRTLGLAVVAEGVETELQSALLLAEGCTLAQGYYFSPPQPASEIPRLLEKLGYESMPVAETA